MKILLISSASVSVHLSAKLHRRFLDDGHEVVHFLTENAYGLKPDKYKAILTATVKTKD